MKRAANIALLAITTTLWSLWASTGATYLASAFAFLTALVLTRVLGAPGKSRVRADATVTTLRLVQGMRRDGASKGGAAL